MKTTQTKGPASRPVLWLTVRSVLVRCTFRRGRSAIHGILRGILGIAHGLLALTLHFLDDAFALQAIGPGGFANALLGLADRLVRGALDLVSGAANEKCSFCVARNDNTGRR